MNFRNITRYFVIIISIFLVWACNSPLNNKYGNGSGGGGGNNSGSETETAGNNLSFPLIYTETQNIVDLNLSVTPVDTVHGTDLNVDYFVAADNDGVVWKWYYQNNEENKWQAGTLLAPLESPDFKVPVDTIDWGDNLEARPWEVGDQIRIEIVLYKILGIDNGYPEMDTYPMLENKTVQLGPLANTMQPNQTGSTGTTEKWGSNLQVDHNGNCATIYSENVKLLIQKLVDPIDGSTPSYAWVNGVWIGDIDAPLVNTTVGSGGFTAEINVQGKLIYGFNWNTKNMPTDELGYYRITFVGLSDIDISDKTQIKIPTTDTEESIILPLAVADPGQGDGGVAYKDITNNLSYIDVYLGARNGSGRPGGNSGQGSGSGTTGNGIGNGHHGSSN